MVFILDLLKMHPLKFEYYLWQLNFCGFYTLLDCHWHEHELHHCLYCHPATVQPQSFMINPRLAQPPSFMVIHWVKSNCLLPTLGVVSPRRMKQVITIDVSPILMPGMWAKTDRWRVSDGRPERITDSMKAWIVVTWIIERCVRDIVRWNGILTAKSAQRSASLSEEIWSFIRVAMNDVLYL